MNLVVAVSGGVDSVVLLDMLVKAGEYKLSIAHFDHGIRKDSIEDRQFVEGLAKKYELLFETQREELGKDASEQLARERRYAFLRKIAKKHSSTIATAHHLNDIAETIAINLARGTGWRGVACLDSDVYRPLLGMTKHEIITYAEKAGLDWREDSTNNSSQYLRNRLRARLSDEDLALQLAALRSRQVELKGEIDAEVAKLIGGADGEYGRYFFTHIPHSVAVELLRAVAVRELGHSLPRPQLERTLLAVKTARPGAKFPFGDGRIVFGKTTFWLSVKTL